jgi:hypothetical protein
MHIYVHVYVCTMVFELELLHYTCVYNVLLACIHVVVVFCNVLLACILAVVVLCWSLCMVLCFAGVDRPAYPPWLVPHMASWPTRLPLFPTYYHTTARCAVCGTFLYWLSSTTGCMPRLLTAFHRTMQWTARCCKPLEAFATRQTVDED